MKLVVGKQYLTKYGKVARCICTDVNRSGKYTSICLREFEPSEEQVVWYTQDGISECCSDWDIVDEQTETLKIKVSWEKSGPSGPVYPFANEFFNWDKLIGKKGTLIFEEEL